MPDEGVVTELLARVRGGDNQAKGALFEMFRERLGRMVSTRLDRRLQAKINASDVMQDAFLEYASSLPTYLANPQAPILLWLRVIVGRKLNAIHRAHLNTGKRNGAQEVPLFRNSWPSANSQWMAMSLAGNEPTPSGIVAQHEQAEQIRSALDQLDPIDREILCLRHFEHLTHVEAAVVLGLNKATASKRYLRALARLRSALPQ